MSQGISTLNRAAYERLRADILSGRLRPGDRLKFAALSERYGTSASVLREALAKLSAEKLVVETPRRGFRVVPLSTEDLEDLTAVRCDIECMAFRHSIERGDLAWESRLIAAHHTLENTPMTVDGDPELFREEWAKAHSHFHVTLFDACGSRRLHELAVSLRDSAELYRHWSRPIGKDQDRDIAGEHRRLLEAALARDADTGAARLRAHITRTTHVLLDAVSGVGS
ncbi:MULTISPECIES: GntR family transcriptional regulator [Streptosporangium]|uniref:DNA-binding GntR family transcriptional regulator n=1 Tax=Streptosporangium brasiliense TaxID=47480 RepID=A0ABT9RGD1_9ACTN|nr:GntR family transcriptional regulator [Streptosporangium brasiliense]MDP9868322.1 DNA-binding GntR family transcriptional regulator [Streptosporangium brasiliense]